MRSLGITLFTILALAVTAWAAQTDQASSGTASALPTNHFPMVNGRLAQPSSQTTIPSGLRGEALKQWVAQHIKGQNTVTLPLNDPRLPKVSLLQAPKNTASVPWGREVQITNYPYVWDYSTDYTRDGNFFVSYVDSSQRVWTTYLSTDDGITWAYWQSVGLGDTSVHIGFPDAFHILTRNSSVNEMNNRIYYFLGYQYQGNNFFDVWYTPLDSPSVIRHGAAFLTTPNTPSFVVTADWYVNTGLAPYYHIIYKKGVLSDSTFWLTSTDRCSTFAYSAYGFTSWPLSIQMGDTYGQYVKYAFNYLTSVDTMNIYFNADTSYGFWTSFIGDMNTMRRTSGRRLHPKLIPIQRDGTFSNLSWIAYQRLPYPYTLYYIYSRDGGLTWPDSTVVGPLLSDSTGRFTGDILGWGNGYPDVFWRRLSSSGNDSMRYSFSYEGNPNTWSAPFGVNTTEPDNYSDPGVVYSSRQSGPGVIFGGPDVGFWAQGLYFDSGWITSGVEKGGLVARSADLELGSARPNPFSRTAAIAFSLPKQGNVDLAVYDIAGRRVATLANGTLSAGSYEASFNGSRVPAGVYFYRLSFEGRTLTNRMVVVR